MLTGGVGSVGATLAGALLLGLIFNILNFENGWLDQPVGLLAIGRYAGVPAARRHAAEPADVAHAGFLKDRPVRLPQSPGGLSVAYLAWAKPISVALPRVGLARRG